LPSPRNDDDGDDKDDDDDDDVDRISECPESPPVASMRSAPAEARDGSRRTHGSGMM